MNAACKDEHQVLSDRRDVTRIYNILLWRGSLIGPREQRTSLWNLLIREFVLTPFRVRNWNFLEEDVVFLDGFGP